MLTFDDKLRFKWVIDKYLCSFYEMCELFNILKGHTHLVALSPGNWSLGDGRRRATGHWAMAIAGRPVAGEISNMLDISQLSPNRPTIPVTR